MMIIIMIINLINGNTFMITILQTHHQQLTQTQKFISLTELCEPHANYTSILGIHLDHKVILRF